MTATAAVDIRRDLVYASADGVELALDLYLPTGAAGPVPVVLYMHGGAFMVGTRADHAEARLLPVAAAGVAVASAQYRFSDVATYPAQIHDAKAAVRWLRAHAGQHGLAPERIGAWGASAGGYLALMLGLTNGVPELEGTVGAHGDENSSVEAVCAWFAPVDLVRADAGPPPGRPLPPFITGPPPEPSIISRLLGVREVADDMALARAASPITHVSGSSPPVLLVHGDRDGLMSEEQSLAMHEALLSAGADSSLLLVAGANHEDPAFHKPAVLGAVTAFFEAVLT